VTPTLDFELDASIQHSEAVSQPFTPEKQYSATGSSLYKTFTQKNQAHFINNKSDLEHWDNSFEEKKPVAGIEINDTNSNFQTSGNGFPSYLKDIQQIKVNKKPSSEDFIQAHKTFILAANDNGFYCNSPAECT